MSVCFSVCPSIYLWLVPQADHLFSRFLQLPCLFRLSVPVHVLNYLSHIFFFSSTKRLVSFQFLSFRRQSSNYNIFSSSFNFVHIILSGASSSTTTFNLSSIRVIATLIGVAGDQPCHYFFPHFFSIGIPIKFQLFSTLSLVTLYIHSNPFLASYFKRIKVGPFQFT